MGHNAIRQEPDNQVLAYFDVRVSAPLGGRLNLHWLVESRNEQRVLRRWAGSRESVDYEVRLVAQLAARGWPVAPVVEGPVEMAGYFWSLAPFLPGEPAACHGPVVEQRARGRLLARLHADLIALDLPEQRPGWRRCEQILADAALDDILNRNERTQEEEVRILRWHLERARERVAGIPLVSRPGMVIHGDFTPWNLLFNDGRLSGVLDFELAHWNHRVGDFALSWRGQYDAVIYGYNEESPLEPVEWMLITPVWWASLIENACTDMRNGTRDDGWTIRKLLQRSPLMGPLAVEYRQSRCV